MGLIPITMRKERDRRKEKGEGNKKRRKTGKRGRESEEEREEKDKGRGGRGREGGRGERKQARKYAILSVSRTSFLSVCKEEKKRSLIVQGLSNMQMMREHCSAPRQRLIRF